MHLLADPGVLTRTCCDTTATSSSSLRKGVCQRQQVTRVRVSRSRVSASAGHVFSGSSPSGKGFVCLRLLFFFHLSAVSLYYSRCVARLLFLFPGRGFSRERHPRKSVCQPFFLTHSFFGLSGSSPSGSSRWTGSS